MLHNLPLTCFEFQRHELFLNIKLIFLKVFSNCLFTKVFNFNWLVVLREFNITNRAKQMSPLSGDMPPQF